MPRHPFYNSEAWKRLRKYKLGRDPLCEICNRLVATDVDHKVAINQGGDALAMDNLQSLCHKCHSRKTYFVEVLHKDSVPMKEIDPKTGRPMDPNHWWNNGA